LSDYPAGRARTTPDRENSGATQQQRRLPASVPVTATGLVLATRSFSDRPLRSEAPAADILNMRVILWFAVVGVVAMLALGARGSAGPAWAAGTHTIAKAQAAAGTSSGAAECVLKAHDRNPPVLRRTTSGGPASVQAGSVGSGNFVVEIPPVVFIRADDGMLVVTTNTGEPPQKRDVYFYVADGKAAAAGVRMQHYVLSKCTMSWRRSASA